ncbi:MAG TPA: spore coat protein [Sneathiellales bacterium]|nr:spore coat protein [Sneathiellales bacterium]
MIAAIIQARTSSKRLPGKVLMPLLGMPMLGRQIERVRHARTLDEIVVATSHDPSDQALVDFCQSINIRCVRGDLDDVLERYHLAAEVVGASVIVRLTGDCPLCDPGVIDALVDKYAMGGFDYVSNTLSPTFPDGLDTEAFSRQALDTAYRCAELPSEREHVTSYIKNSEAFTKFNFENDVDLSGLRWTIDEPEDFELIRRIFEELYPQNPMFGMSDILNLLERHSAWSDLNRHIGRDEGYARSLMEDETYERADRDDEPATPKPWI